MNELYPFESRYFDRGGGVRMHYVDEGPRDADPIVMVHGNPSWSFYYREVIRAFRGTHRCIAMDHIGMGRSDKPGDAAYRYTLDSRVDDLEKLLAHLGVERNVTLIVHDWGGMIGMAWASRKPDRIARLVVLNTAAFRLPAGKPLPFSLWLCRNTKVGALLVRGFNFFARGAATNCVTRRPMTPAVKRGFVGPYDSWRSRIATLRFVQDIPLAPGDSAYATVLRTEQSLPAFTGKPMLICWGARDFVFDDDFLNAWRQHFPGAKVHRFADSGHYVLEDAGDEIIALIGGFLDQP